MDYIYLVECEGFYKIGVACDFKLRLSSMQGNNPFEIHTVAFYRVNLVREVEKRFHQKFSSKRVRREWFSLSQDDIEYFMAEGKSIEDKDTLDYVEPKRLVDSPIIRRVRGT